MPEIKAKDIALMRFANSGITKPFASAYACARALFGIQGQVQQFTEIALYNRVKNLDRKKLQKLYDSHDFIKIWAQRKTVHIFSKDDWCDIIGVYSQRPSYALSIWEGDKRGLDKAIKALGKYVEEGEHKSRAEIREFMETFAPDKKCEYLDYCAIAQASVEGLLFGVPEHPHTKQFKHRKFCFEDAVEPNANALERIMRLYFKHYAPAGFSDFMHWSGLNKSEALSVFEKLKPEMKSFSFNGKDVFSLNKNEKIEKGVQVRMLGKFDPLLVAYSDKTWIADAPGQKLIWRSAGHVEAILAIGGEFAGTWRHEAKGKNIAFNFFLSRKLSKNEKIFAEAEALKIAAFLGKDLQETNFRQA